MAANLLDLTYTAGIEVQRNVPLAPYSTLKIGGLADFFARPKGAKELSRCLSAAQEAGIPWLLLGGGSNMLISDRGFRGLAIKAERPATKQRNSADVLALERDAVHLRCDAGLATAGLSRWAAGLGWTGLEWAAGIPGTIGGAAAGNAGAYGGDMQQCVERVLAWFPDGERVVESADLGYGYRASRFKRSADPAAILSVDVRLVPASKEECVARIEENEKNRREKQPTERSCGSVFKNPYQDHSGRLIEAAGLKGASVGGAEISLKHGNFFINRGDATAAAGIGSGMPLSAQRAAASVSGPAAIGRSPSVRASVDTASKVTPAAAQSAARVPASAGVGASSRAARPAVTSLPTDVLSSR